MLDSSYIARPGRYFLPLVFPLFSAYACFAIFGYASKTDLFRLIQYCVDNKLLPGSGQPLRTAYTGIEVFDRLLTVLTIFFVPAVDGSNPSLLLHSIMFSGAFGSAWILVVLEAWRRGNSEKWFSFPFIFGIGAQLMTFAVFTPLYFGIQLVGSDTSFQPTTVNIAIPPAVLKSIPMVFVLAYQLPSLAMLIPAPSIVTFDQKQLLIALWQPWPVYVSLLITLAFLMSSQPASKTPLHRYRKSLDTVYTFAFTHAAICHVVAWTVSLATLLQPAIFFMPYTHSLHPGQVFLPDNPFQNHVPRIDNVGEGVHKFLQWDNIVGSAAVLFWAASVNAIARFKIQGRIGCLGLFVKIARYLVLAGPVATAVQLVWERDELVLEREAKKRFS